MPNRTATLLALAVSFLVTGVLSALETTVIIGGDAGWDSSIHTQGLVFAAEPLPAGPHSLMPYRNEPDADTELLVSFEALPVTDTSGNFTVSAPNAEISYSTRRSGRGSLLIDSPEDRLSLIPRGSRYFTPGVEWGSFVLEFWLYPVTLSDGEQVLAWEGREAADLSFRTQRVTAEIDRRRLRFVFENFFVPANREPLTVVLEGRDGLIPRNWAHHQVLFDASTGRLEYRVDGLTASVTHASRTGTEDGTVFFPRMATFPPQEIVIAPQFTGAIDEFRLLRRGAATNSETSSLPIAPPLYDAAGGVFASEIIDLGSPGATLLSLATHDRTPGMSEIFYFIKVADQTSGPDTLPGEWVPVPVDAPSPEKTGRFVQVRAELYPDPGISATPELLGISLIYEEDPPPYPPSRLIAVPGDGSVDLSWAGVLEPDIKGYLVYYGNQPGRYFGSGSDLGPSPVDVGQATSTTLTGLTNGTLYYFAVGAYDASGPGSTIELSSEAAARPARVYR